LAEELRGAHEGATVVRLDVRDEASIGAAAELVQARFGRLDGLVNNAAISYDAGERATTVRLETVHDALETNLFGAWRTIQRFLPLLRKSRHGRIVNVSSEAGSISEMEAGTPAYAVSKAALNVLTRIVAAELRADRILVNAVCPGWTATDMGGRGGRPVAEGAASIVWGIVLPDDGPTGGFFRDGAPLPW
jgi:NAD(P)-dependent dehydrogenase (short-subunit alcohol dehydrogenase family)